MALGRALHAAKLAAERAVARMLRACAAGGPPGGDARLRALAAALEPLVATVEDLQARMQAERARARPIVATFVTFKCSPPPRTPADAHALLALAPPTTTPAPAGRPPARRAR